MMQQNNQSEREKLCALFRWTNTVVKLLIRVHEKGKNEKESSE